MTEAVEEKQESQKTIVAFVAGLLIGGLLVWIFSGPGHDKPEHGHDHHDGEKAEEMMEDEEMEANTATETPAEMPDMVTGDGNIMVADQAAGSVVAIDGATFPNDEGWIAVRSYQNDQMGNILGAARFSKEQNLVPQEVSLLAPTVAGNSYAVVFFTEDGDRTFNLANDAQVEGVWATFVAK